MDLKGIPRAENVDSQWYIQHFQVEAEICNNLRILMHIFHMTDATEKTVGDVTNFCFIISYNSFKFMS